MLFFGQLAELTGSAKICLQQVQDTDALRQQLIEKYPGLQQATYLVAVNKEVVNQNTLLQHQAEVALLPPYAGG